MNDREKSDGSVVPEKPPNKSGAAAPEAEAVEGRELAKGNLVEGDMPRTQRRNESMPSALDRIREAASRDGKQCFTSLMHHVYDVDRLRAAYKAIRKDAAAGVDRVTWEEHGEDLEANLRDLAGRLACGGYRAKPVRRVHIPKADGGQRPLGVPTLEDKVVQRSVAEVLGAIYETDFLGFSYGFRPGRSQHHALDALTVAITTRTVRWVLDADIRGFFDTLDHGWLIKFIEHRIGDQRVVKLIRKWLNAGVLEDGERVRVQKGTVQGGSISPLLANIYLHYVLDLWVQQWRQKRARGDMVIVRFADDFVAGFAHQADGEQCQTELRERFAKFGLELHPDKTRLIEFGRFAGDDRHRRRQGNPKPSTSSGSRTFAGRHAEESSSSNARRRRRSSRRSSRRCAGTCDVAWIGPSHRWGGTSRQSSGGTPTTTACRSTTGPCLASRWAIGSIWKWVLERRSERTRIRWDRMQRLIAKWLPPARVCHPFPDRRFRRHYPRQEPDAVVPHVRICAGGPG